jgi:hypothetical protein
MRRSEEAALLLRTGCPPANMDALLRFAGEYRTCMVPSDGALRVRRLGTRALLRVSETGALPVGSGREEDTREGIAYGVPVCD